MAQYVIAMCICGIFATVTVLWTLVWCPEASKN